MKFSEVVGQTLAWLQREGRVSYPALKREFDLDDDTLEDLKAELIEVKELAVDKDGKMLVWVGEGGKGETAKRGKGEKEVVSSQISVFSPQYPTPNTQPPAERRQLTVMFCDLVGSTAISEQLDPEELREVIRTYQATCARVINRYEGHIAQYLGDGLLVYFGYPVAHEDDAQRAVRTGLEIIEALQSRARQQAVNRPLPHGRGSDSLHVRIGIHTGLVVIGEIGSSAKREMLALGETPNLAARLQGLAAPDTVVISAATHRLIEGLFDCRDLGAHAVKGVSTPLQVYQVVGESGVRSRLEAAATRGLTPLVGREEEAGLLRKRWEQALRSSRDALALAQSLSHPPSLVFAPFAATFLHQFRREGSAAQSLAEAVSALSSEHGLPQWGAWGTILRGWALAEQNHREEGIAQMGQGLAACHTMGTVFLRPYFLALLAEAYGKVGQAEEGLNALSEALTLVNKTGERHHEAELYRLKGTLTLQSQASLEQVSDKSQAGLGEVSNESQTSQGKSEVPKAQSPTSKAQSEAEACFLKAIDIAQKQQAKSLELRAVMSLVRLRQRQATQEELRNTEHASRTALAKTHQMLSEVYNWFTEGFDTKDLQEAKMLLEELNQRLSD
jgi:class 3 adenylate cyclase